MRSPGFIIVASAAWLAATAGEGSAQDKPALHDMNAFMARGAFTELNRDLARHRLTLKEIEDDGLDGRPIPIGDLVEKMAKYEKLRSRVDEPLEVRGEIRVGLTPNTTGEEAYTTCFLALTYNGLVLSGGQDELILVRPETRPALTPPRRRWDRAHILSTRLFRLGYLAPDPILRGYRDKIGTGAGHAVIVPKANVVIVTDTDAAIEKLGSWIDSETLAAMGTMAPEASALAEGTRPPSAGAIASRECVHFYLLAFARTNRHFDVRGAAAGIGDEALCRGRRVAQPARLRGRGSGVSAGQRADPDRPGSGRPGVGRSPPRPGADAGRPEAAGSQLRPGQTPARRRADASDEESREEEAMIAAGLPRFELPGRSLRSALSRDRVGTKVGFLAFW